jgi:putative hydrolase of the HAD superfamily
MPMNIVFDFGAVVFSWRPNEIVRGMFPQQAPTEAAARALAGEIFHHQDWQDFDRGTIASAEVVARAAQRLVLPQPAVQALVAAIPQYLTPIPATVDLLARLRERRDTRGDIRLYYLSNMPAPYARILEQRHAFLQWFDGGMFSADVKTIKPQPEIFRLLESRYGLVPARTVFIDDLPANVEAARMHGWHALHFESAAHLEPMLAAHIA